MWLAQAGQAAQGVCPARHTGRCSPVAQILLIYLTVVFAHPVLVHGGCPMTRFLLVLLLGVSAALGLLRPLPLDVRGVGRRADPRADPRDRPPGRRGDLSRPPDAAGCGSMRPATWWRPASWQVRRRPRRAARPRCPRTPLPPRVALLDLRGTCRTLVIDLASFTVAPLTQALTLVPVVLAPDAAPKEERLLQRALCTVGAPPGPGVARAARTGGRLVGARPGEGR